jgi:hypothetical protein
MKSFWIMFLAVGLFSCGSMDKNEADKSNQTSFTPPVIVADQTLTEKGIMPVINAYYALKDAFVEADSVMIDKTARELLELTDSLNLSEILTDSSLVAPVEIFRGNIAAETKGLIGESDLTEKRRAFSMISQNLLPMLQEIKYSASPVYQQICPMAFNDDEKAFWLSNSSEIMNPYLGKKHPKYKAGMLHCGELGDSLMVK